jgi:hypothetical protein
VFCQLVHLRSCIPQEESIRRALDELPETLDETYARSLEEIGLKKRKYAHLIFQCVAAASRPLLLSELAEFFAIDFEAGSTPTLLADRRLEDPAHTVLSVCSSLLVIVEPGSGSPVVQFAHFSVKEYLTSVRLAGAKDTISRFHVSMSAAHTIVARACCWVFCRAKGPCISTPDAPTRPGALSGTDPEVKFLGPLGASCSLLYARPLPPPFTYYSTMSPFPCSLYI